MRQKIEILFRFGSILISPTKANMSVVAQHIFDLQQYPGIYIPMLFQNISEKQLRKIIEELNIFKPKIISMESKVLNNGTHCNMVFIDVEEWYHTPNAKRMRSKLLSDQEVKIIFNDPWFFICKRKHMTHEVASSTTSNPPPPPPPPEAYIDFRHIAPIPTNVAGFTRSPTPSDDSSYCPECEEGIDGNQLRHTCIQRMMEEGVTIEN
jgi:hypothetical protein